MIRHIELGDTPFKRSRHLKLLINKGAIQFGGNAKLKIYGKLSCGSGMRMKVENRVFFASEVEAARAGYRPCGHCMREAYKGWKKRDYRNPVIARRNDEAIANWAKFPVKFAIATLRSQ